VRADIACDSPTNIERRDYIGVEHEVWDARAEIGEFPMTIVSNDYGANAAPGDEQTNVTDQQTWLVLSRTPSRWSSPAATTSCGTCPPS
jgi:hypothetical protein